ncbi:MAG TPA: TIGR02444 family protein [Xanthobacteraceae bacterium]|jgi:uncharacterized protein (TIGR02444 family)
MATPNPPISRGSPFWRFSLGFYRRPGVADACIRLQEESGLDVNLLLFLLWQATHRRALSVAEVEHLEGRIAAWRETTVVPLRRMRRALKSPPDLIDGGTAELFRTRIKAVELEAERLQQEAMHDLARSMQLGRETPSRTDAARANVAAYAQICRAGFAEAAVETLLAALAGLEHSEEE